MIQLRQNLHFAIKPRHFAQAGERTFAHDFDRDAPLGGLLRGLVYDTLTAAMDFAQYLIARQSAGEKWTCALRAADGVIRTASAPRSVARSHAGARRLKARGS